MPGRCCLVVWVALLACSIVASGSRDPSLSGTWYVWLDFDPMDPTPLAATTAFNVTYSVGEWLLASSSSIDDTGWSDQTFEAGGALGALGVTSTLQFDPAAGTFTQSATSMSWGHDDVAFSSRFELTPLGLALSVEGYVDLDAVSIGATVGFRSTGADCGLLFDEVTIFSQFPFCCSTVSAELSISCAGFEIALFSVYGLRVPRLPWLTLDVDLSFEPDAKSLDMWPIVSFGTVGCLDLFIDVETSGHLSFGDIRIYGIGLRCEVGGVSFEGISYLDGSHLIDGRYWESYSIAWNREGCCGPASGRLECFFLSGGMRLFDLAVIVGTVSFEANEHFAAETSVTIDVETGAEPVWALGLSVDW